MKRREIRRNQDGHQAKQRDHGDQPGLRSAAAVEAWISSRTIGGTTIRARDMMLEANRQHTCTVVHRALG
jgi:hypothetical protein